MSMPVFSDEAPSVEARGDQFIYTYTFEGEKHHLILSRHAAIQSAMLTLQALGAPPNKAWIRTLEAHREQQLPTSEAARQGD